MKLVINSKSNSPIYLQILKQLRTQIFNGEIEADYELPSIRSLAKSLKTSVITIKRVYQELLNEGLIYTLPGKGSYVAKIEKRIASKTKTKEIKQKIKDLKKLAQEYQISNKDLKSLILEELDE